MLDVNPETVCRLIELAKIFHAQEEIVIPEVEDDPSSDWAMQMLTSHADDYTFLEFKSIVNDLEPDQQQQLVALLWLGREDFTLEEWQDAVRQAGENWGTNTAEYLIVHPLLADYLEEGLDAHGYVCDKAM